MMASVDLLLWLYLATLLTSVAVCILALLPRLLRKTFGARAAYAMWWCLPIMLIASTLPTRIAEREATRVTVLQPLMLPVQTIVQPTPALVAQGMSAIDIASVLLVVWVLGFCAMALYLWRQQRRFLSGLGQLQHLSADLWRAQTSHGLPALLGGLRTRIILPEDFEQRYQREEQALMLAHERLHRGRGDHLANLSMAILRCVFWFNPIMHWAQTRFRHDQELACDEAVIEAHPHSRRTYGEAMLKTLMADRQAPLGCHWGFSHPLKERVMQLKSPLPRTWVRRIGVGSVAVLALSAGFAVWSSQPARSLDAQSLKPRSLAVAEKDNDGVYFDVVLLSANTKDPMSPRIVSWLGPGMKIPLGIDVEGENEALKIEQMYSVERNEQGRMVLTVKLKHYTPVLGYETISKQETFYLDVDAEGSAQVERSVGADGERLRVQAHRGLGPCAGKGASKIVSPGQEGKREFRCLESKKQSVSTS